MNENLYDVGSFMVEKMTSTICGVNLSKYKIPRELLVSKFTRDGVFDGYNFTWNCINTAAHYVNEGEEDTVVAVETALQYYLENRCVPSEVWYSYDNTGASLWQVIV